MKFPFRISNFNKLNHNKINTIFNLHLVFFTCICFTACQNSNQKNTQKNVVEDNLEVLVIDSTEITTPKEIQFSLALSPNAIQIINQNNGSTTEISFKTPLKQTIETVERVLKAKPSIGINSECGAGPLKMATWNNVLTLLFQEKKNDEWLFVGWAANQAINPELKLITMAGVGIGSTRKEIESAYVIEVTKTSLGYEFATKTDDFFGIFDGANENAKITNLWSGLSCNFR
jgi:hypothetical protein